MPERTFGKYQVLVKLASGGAASVFLARQPGAAGFHKLVCLKTLLPERARDEEFVAMFLDEARLAALLHHPNCVHVYDLGKVDDLYFISMEYIFGETLWGLLSSVARTRSPLPHPHVASIVASVCDGLHHAHELKNARGEGFNLVHRDISPQNVMVTYEGQTKILDFGIAKAETGRPATSAGIVKGKFSYMSPEQIAGLPLDRRSDIYSLGIVLFECLASRRLYRADSPEDIARLILEHRAPRLRDVVPEVPLALDEIVAKALARRPAKRFQTAQEMAEALRSYLDSIRHVQSAASIARLFDERFSQQIADRRRVYDAALAGECSEGELVRAFEGSPVREVDFLPPPASGPMAPLGQSVAQEPQRTDPVGPTWSMEARLAEEMQGLVDATSTELPSLDVARGLAASAVPPAWAHDRDSAPDPSTDSDFERTQLTPVHELPDASAASEEPLDPTLVRVRTGELPPSLEGLLREVLAGDDPQPTPAPLLPRDLEHDPRVRIGPGETPPPALELPLLRPSSSRGAEVAHEVPSWDRARGRGPEGVGGFGPRVVVFGVVLGFALGTAFGLLLSRVLTDPVVTVTVPVASKGDAPEKGEAKKPRSPSSANVTRKRTE